MIGFALVILTLILLLVYYVSTRKFDYWEKRKIPYPKPWPILGNYGGYILMTKYQGQIAQSICQKFPKAPYIGTFYGTEPALVVQDPEIIKHIMTKDYYYFSSREVSKYTHHEVFTQNLFFTYGDRWRVMRQNLTPIFSSAKMKNMFYLIEERAHVFENMLDKEVRENNIQEVKELIERFTMDCVGTCVFGVDMNSMEMGWQQNDFTHFGRLLLLPTKYRGFKLIARAIWPAIFYGLRMKCFPPEIDRFFLTLMVQVFKKRDYKPTSRNDFVDLVLSMKKDNYISGDSIENYKGANEKISLKLDDEFLVAQCVLLFAAGFETSSTGVHFTLYELAKNQETQKKALEEVDEYLRRHNNQIGYECVTELPYLEACIDEGLRMYPVLGVLTREAVDDYKLPCGLVLEKGMRVHLPVYHLHHNPEFFPNPEEFRPERFLGEEKRNIKPYTYIPFGEGPRVCLGKYR